MREKPIKRYLQIIPAEGWFAAYALSTDGGVRFIDQAPVAGWALVEDYSIIEEDGLPWRDIRGFTAGVDGVLSGIEEDENFIGYGHKDDADLTWLKSAAEQYWKSKDGEN